MNTDAKIIRQIIIGVIGILIASGATSLNITWATARQNERDTIKLATIQSNMLVEIKELDGRIDESDIRWAKVEETMKWLEKYLENQRVPRPK